MANLTFLEQCDDKLSLNPLATTIRFTQLVPVNKVSRTGTTHLTYQPLNPFFDLDREKITIIAQDLADRIHVEVPKGVDPGPAPLPDPTKDTAVKSKLSLMVRNKFISAESARGMSDSMVHNLYRGFVRNLSEQQRSFFLGTLAVSPKDFEDKQKLAEALLSSPFFNSYFTSSQKYHFAILISLEQEWLHTGYSRGELVK
jgi:hypothetical protein